MSRLTDAMLAVTTAPPVVRDETVTETVPLSARIETAGDKLTVEAKGETGAASEKVVRDHLHSRGLDPDKYVVEGFRSSEWTMPNGATGESTRYTFRKVAVDREPIPIDDLVEAVSRHEPVAPIDRPDGDGFVALIGDMQFGKGDGDGVDGTVNRALAGIDRLLDLYLDSKWSYSHVHIGWLGDHVEGFVSQGGASAWRTKLTLTQQIRLTRRVMLYAVEQFAPHAQKLTVAAVPGNHGETIRFSGTGVTRYDDSHDTEALVAVADACKLNLEAFGHVQFYTPTSDELTVVVEVAGTVIAHAHGHQWKTPGKHFAWWKGQAFGKAVSLEHADVLVAGHFHHLLVEEDGRRTFVQVPALEAESTWYRHSTGTPGNPGMVALVVRNGIVRNVEVIR